MAKDPGHWRVIAARLALADRSNPESRVERPSPSLKQVVSLFSRLAHSTGGDLFISGTPGDRELMVAGGPSLFLVSCVGDGFGAYNLVDPSAGRTGWLTLIAGGVPSSVEAAATVGAELAEQAIRYFYAHGDIDPELEWE